MSAHISSARFVPRVAPRQLLLLIGCLYSVAYLVHSQAASGSQVHRRFEYKHSFRRPNLAQRDGTVVFWQVSGDAIASGEQLRLAPSMRSRRGMAWNKKAMTESEFWEVEMSLKVTGQGRIGADGLAMWYTASMGQLGPVFGSNDYWTGLGIFFDSFDNDGQRNNPIISVMINDGTRSYDHQTDGSQQMLGSCQKDFRNKPYPLKVKIEYIRNVLQVLVHDGMTQHDRYELCMRAENIFLPKNGFFGLSAATGGLADDHDVTSFSVSSLLTETPQPPATIPQDERKKYEQEFEKQWQEYEQQREKFKKEHPDKVKDEDDLETFAKAFEDATARELRMIYESQNSIHNVIQQLEAKVQRVLDQQNHHTQLIQQVRAGGAGAVQPQGGGGGTAPMVDTFQRHEVNEIMQMSREMSAAIKEMKTYVNDVYSRAYNIEQKVMGAGTGGNVQPAGGTGGTDNSADMQWIRNYLENIKTDVGNIRTNQQNQMGAPPGGDSIGGGCANANCLTSTFFMALLASQTALLVVVFYFKKGSDKAKFY